MKLLYITPRLPYPPVKGDQSVPYHRLRILGKRHEITLLTFIENEKELLSLEALRPFCKRIHPVMLPKWRSFANMVILCFFSSLPLQVLYYHSAIFNKHLHSLLSTDSFDLIHAYMLRVAPYLTDNRSGKILDLIDSMQLNFKRRVETGRFPVRYLFREELKRLARYEGTICNKFDRCIVVSAKDRDYLQGDNIDVIPLGVETSEFAPGAERRHTPTIIFSGNMHYNPNIQAITWFIRECFPEIQKEIPSVSLVIAGNNPSPDICRVGAQRGITVTGFVESMPEVLNQASVSIAPMRSGSGMQFKILEAMSCGLPVVTTSLGLGDIKAQPDRDIIVADTVDDYTNRLILLLKDSTLSRRLGNNAREFVVRHHSWEQMVNRVESLYSQVLSTREVSKGIVSRHGSA